MPRMVEVEEQIYTHEHLWRSSTVLLTQAQSNPEKAYYFLLPALLTSFLAFEAFVNFCGHVLAPELWIDEKKNFQGKGLEGKLGAISEKLPSFLWEKGRPPYQKIKLLENFRDMTAHGKVIVSNYDTVKKDDGTHFKFNHPWDEYLSVASVISARKEIVDFSESILVAARIISDDPHLCFSAYEGSLASATGISKPS